MSSDLNKWTVVTGSTGGIGSEVTSILASRSHHLILVNRSGQSGQAQLEHLLGRHPALKVEVVTADFMDTDSIRAAIEVLCALPGPIGSLYNIAGVLNAERILSKQGFESNFAVNTLAPYQLIKGLRRKMTPPPGSGESIIVNLSSSAIFRQRSLEVSRLTRPSEVTGLMGTYAQSKLALSVLSVALAPELSSDRILIRAIDPGATKTAMTTNNAAMPRALQWLAPLFFGDPAKNAGKVVESALPSEFGGATGLIISRGRRKNLPKATAHQEQWRQLIAVLDNALEQSD
ncbi:MAG: SDR family NAD(P)-dependent oxidoreductase [Pseudomonadota bacterium]